MELDFSKGRRRPANYLRICASIADTYPQGIYHGVQKDAIQNGVDAVVGRGPLLFTFELVENERGRFLVMTDANTTGLTGRVLLTDEEYEEDLPESERWGRFESFAFTKDAADALGARGQGKFIFIAASEKHRMLYDTLRADGIYRAGATEAHTTDCPILPGPGQEPWEGNVAQDIIRRQTGLPPLSSVGTRVIIVDPIPEVVETLRDGRFLKAIEETWFRLIEKGKAVISVVVDGKTWRAKVPKPYPVPDKDSRDFKTWVLGRDFREDLLRIGGEEYRVKHFRVAYSRRSPVPEEFRGVAIIHYGMKITTITSDIIPPADRDKIFGYIEFDRALDRELRKTENQTPNHYDLQWRRRVPRAIKQYIQEQLTAFGNEKLGLGLDPREKQSRTRQEAEDWAMRQLVKYAADFKLFSRQKGAVRRPPPPVPPPKKDLGVALRGFRFPDPDIAPRVNWGHVISGFNVAVYNKTNNSFEGFLSLFVLYGDSEMLRPIDRATVTIAPKRPELTFGPINIPIERRFFPEPGLYRLRAALYRKTDGKLVDRVTRIIFVEKDPEFRTPFQVRAVERLPEQRQWYAYFEDDDPILLYSLSHPCYDRVKEDPAAAGAYLFEVFLEGAVWFILSRAADAAENPYAPLDSTRIVSEDPREEYDEIALKLAQIRARFYAEN